MQTERINYLSNFEEKLVEHGVGIQHVFGDGDEPSFSYTVGLFESQHPEFIVFGMPPELSQSILNDLASQVLHSGLRFGDNERVHQVFRGAVAFLVEARDPAVDFFGTAHSIRDRRYPELAGTELEALQLLYQDPGGRWPWEAGSDYENWPLLGPAPRLDAISDVTIPRD